MKKCLIFFMLLFVLLFAVSVSADIIYYNYSGISSPSSTHKAFYGNTTDLTPSNSTLGTETEFGGGSNKYSNLSLSDNFRAYQNHSDSSFHKFVFLINEANSSINRLNLTWEGYTSTALVSSLYILNNSNWNKIDSASIDTDINISVSYTGNISSYINNSNHLVLLLFSDNPIADSFIFTDFVQVIVDNTTSLEISNVQTHSGIFSYGVSWDTNLAANGSLNITNSSGYQYNVSDSSYTTSHTIWYSGTETLPASFMINITSCTSSGDCTTSLNHNATMFGDAAGDPITQLNITLISPVNSTNTTSKNNTFSFNASTSPFILYNASIYTNESGTWKSNYTIQVNGTFNSSLFYLNNTKDGKFKWNVYACDIDRQCNYSRNNWTFTVDTVVPNVTNVYPINSSELTLPSGQVNFTFNTSDTTIGVTNCSLWLSNVNSTTLIRNSTDTSITELVNQTINVTNLRGGAYKWNVECVDYTNNKGNSTINNFTIGSVTDTTKPSVSLISPTNYLNSSNNSITFNISADNTALKNISIFTNTTGSWIRNLTIGRTGVTNSSNFTITNIKDGTYIWGGHSCDSSGNCNVSINRTFTVDTLRINLTLNKPVSFYNSSVTEVIFNVTVADKNVKNVSLYGNFSGTFTINQTNTSGITDEYLFNLTISSGTYLWGVKACDTSGNCNMSNRTLTIDTTAVALTLTNPAGFYNSSRNKIEFNATISNGNLKNVSLYGNWSGSFTINQTNVSGVNDDYSFTVNLSDGKYLWGMKACDFSGLCNMSNRTFTVDTVAPNMSKVGISKTCTSATLSWTTNEVSNSSLEYGTSLGLGSSTESNNLVSSHSLSISSLAEGTTYYFNVSSCDPSNNCNVSSGSFLTGTNCQGGGGGSGGGGGGNDDPDPDPEPDLPPIPIPGPIPPRPPGPTPPIPFIPDVPISPDIKNVVTGFFEREFFNKTVVEIKTEYKCNGIVLSLGEIADLQLNLEKEGRFVIPKLFFNFGDQREYCAWCYDGIKDYDEEEVDCGGSCISCSESKSCYDKPLIGIILTLFLLLFVNSILLIETFDKKKFKFGILLMFAVLVLSLIFSWIYFCYSYNWVYGLLVIFLIFYVVIYNNEFGFSKSWKVKKKKYTKYDDLYNYNNVNEKFDRLKRSIERHVRNGKLEKARDKFEELLIIYNQLKKYLGYKETVNLHYKMNRLRNRIEMKILIQGSKKKIKKYKEKKVKVKKKKINLITLNDKISKTKVKFRKVFKRDKELEKLKKQAYK